MSHVHKIKYRINDFLGWNQNKSAVSKKKIYVD